MLSQVQVVVPVPCPASEMMISERSASGGQSHCAAAENPEKRIAAARNKCFMLKGVEVDIFIDKFPFISDESWFARVYP